jgi:hypothetical protein
MTYKFCLFNLILFLAFSDILYAQSKKEQIINLKNENDSIINLIYKSKKENEVLTKVIDSISINQDLYLTNMIVEQNYLKKTIKYLKEKIDSLNKDPFDLGPFNNKCYLAKLYESEDYKHRLVIIIDSNIYGIEKEVDLYFDDQSENIEINNDTSDDLKRTPLQNIRFINENKLIFKNNCLNIPMRAYGNGLSWERKTLNDRSYISKVNKSYYRNEYTNVDEGPMFEFEKVVYYGKDILTIIFSNFDNGYYLNLDLANNKEVELMDIISANKFRTLEARIKKEMIQQDKKFSDFIITSTNLEFEFAHKGINFILDAYDYKDTYGFVDVFLSYNQLKPFMNDNSFTKHLLKNEN